MDEFINENDLINDKENSFPSKRTKISTPTLSAESLANVRSIVAVTSIDPTQQQLHRKSGLGSSLSFEKKANSSNSSLVSLMSIPSSNEERDTKTLMTIPNLSPQVIPSVLHREDSSVVEIIPSSSGLSSSLSSSSTKEEKKLKYWTIEEDLQLAEAVGLYEGMGKGGNVDWSLVAKFLGNRRTYQQCKQRWNVTLKPKMVMELENAAWTVEEDNRLVEAVSVFDGVDGIDWARVSDYVGNDRGQAQCKQRWSVTVKTTTGNSNSLPWTAEEDEQLTQAVKLFEGQGMGGRVNWIKLAEYLGGVRTSQQCNMRWNATLKPRLTGNLKTGAWSPEEDALLAEAIELYDGQGTGGRINWVKVAEHMGGIRSSQQCNQRWYATLKCRMSGEVKAGPWTEEEDAKLKEAVNLFDGHGLGGSVDWIQVANYMSSEVGGVSSKRTSHQCNHRWHDFLQPRMNADLKTGPWSKEEDTQLLAAVKLYDGQGQGGKVKWSKVSEYMKGTRSSQQCRYRWNATLKPRYQNGEVKIKNGSWSTEEDILLSAAVKIYENQGRDGSVDWIRVAEHLGNTRSYVQCRNRWNVLLNATSHASHHDKNHGNSSTTSTASSHVHASWTIEEDKVLATTIIGYLRNQTLDGEAIHHDINWFNIAKTVGHKRSYPQCRQRWQELLSTKTNDELTELYGDGRMTMSTMSMALTPTINIKQENTQHLQHQNHQQSS